MHTSWLEHGPDVINRLIAEQPEVFLQATLKIALVQRVEVGRPEAFDRPCCREEALQRLEESAGPKARKLLEGFLKRSTSWNVIKIFPRRPGDRPLLAEQQLSGAPDRAKCGYRNRDLGVPCQKSAGSAST